MIQRVKRVGLIVLVALVVGGLVPDIVQAQDGPGWVTYTTDDGVLMFDVPAAWAIESTPTGFNLADTDETMSQMRTGSDVEEDHFMAVILIFEDPSGVLDVAHLDEALVQVVTEWVEPPYDPPVAWLLLDEDTVLAADTAGPMERASILRRLNDESFVTINIQVQPGNLVYFLDDLITLAQSIVYHTPDAGLPPLTETYVTLDGTLAIHYPAEWAVHLFSSGTILFGSSQPAIDRLIKRGQVGLDSMLFTLVTPTVVTAFLGDRLTPDTPPEDVFVHMTSLSNARDAYSEIETLLVGDYPAARAFLAQAHFQVVTYTVQLAPGQFAMFDLMVDGRAFEQHQPLLEAIIASAEYLGE